MNAKNNFKRIIQYILSIFLFLSTIVFFPSISSLLFLIVAFVVLPNIWEKLTTHINKKILFILCIIIFLISCSICPIKTNSTITTNQNNIISNNIINNSTTNSKIENNDTSNSKAGVNETPINNTTYQETNTNNSNFQTSSSQSITNTYKSSNSSDASKSDTTSKSKINNNSNINSNNNSNIDSDTVWITKSGKKYHHQNCPTLKGNGFAISIDEAKKQGKESCNVCYR